GEAKRGPFGMETVGHHDAVGTFDGRGVERREIRLERLGQAIESHRYAAFSHHVTTRPCLRRGNRTISWKYKPLIHIRARRSTSVRMHLQRLRPRSAVLP